MIEILDRIDFGEADRYVDYTRPPDVDEMNHVPCDIEFEEVLEAYFDCRKRKRTTKSHLKFEANMLENLFQLHDDLLSGKYRIGTSICFAIMVPVPREVWAANFRDRIVQHIVYNRLAKKFNNRFIRDTFACIPGRGTLDGAKRLERHIRSFTKNHTELKDKYFMKLDLSNFFTSIKKNVVWKLIKPHVKEDWVRSLIKLILFHDPRTDYVNFSAKYKHDQVEDRKKLFTCLKNVGLAIGNITSQFFANVIMNVIDQFIKHVLKVKHYVRYVDDMVFLGDCTRKLAEVRKLVVVKLGEIGLRINPRKSIIQPISRGVTFVGHTITKTGRKVARPAAQRIKRRVYAYPETAHRYFGYMKQFSNKTGFENWIIRTGTKKHRCSLIVKCREKCKKRCRCSINSKIRRIEHLRVLVA